MSNSIEKDICISSNIIDLHDLHDLHVKPNELTLTTCAVYVENMDLISRFFEEKDGCLSPKLFKAEYIDVANQPFFENQAVNLVKKQEEESSLKKLDEEWQTTGSKKIFYIETTKKIVEIAGAAFFILSGVSILSLGALGLICALVIVQGSLDVASQSIKDNHKNKQQVVKDNGILTKAEVAFKERQTEICKMLFLNFQQEKSRQVQCISSEQHNQKWLNIITKSYLDVETVDSAACFIKENLDPQTTLKKIKNQIYVNMFNALYETYIHNLFRESSEKEKEAGDFNTIRDCLVQYLSSGDSDTSSIEQVYSEYVERRNERLSSLENESQQTLNTFDTLVRSLINLSHREEQHAFLLENKEMRENLVNTLEASNKIEYDGYSEEIESHASVIKTRVLVVIVAGAVWLVAKVVFKINSYSDPLLGFVATLFLSKFLKGNMEQMRSIQDKQNKFLINHIVSSQEMLSQRIVLSLISTFQEKQEEQVESSFKDLSNPITLTY